MFQVVNVVTTEALKSALEAQFPTTPTRDEFYAFAVKFYEGQNFKGGAYLSMDTVVTYAQMWAGMKGWNHVR